MTAIWKPLHGTNQVNTNITPTAGFGFNLLRAEVAAHPNENVLVSPVSVSVALGMTANGALGTTQAAMVKALALGEPGESFAPHNARYAALLNELKGSKLGVKLSIANAIWAAEGTEFEQDFLTTCWQKFKSVINVADFADPETLVALNKWCADNTNNLITKILEEIDPQNLMYLLNAVYFKGTWTTKFDKDDTTDQPFQTAGGSKQHPLMFRSGDMRYTQTADYQLVALPFGEAKRINLYVFLPAVGKSPVDVLAGLNQESYEGTLAALWESDGQLHLPRFQLDYAAQLNKSLEALGMGPALKKGADFSAMCKSPALHITDVQHKTFAKFDEEGGEAAAVTSVGMGFESVCMTWTMKVDRPFVAVLADEQTGAVLFAGVVYNP